MIDKVVHTSLQRKSVTYAAKKFYEVCPWGAISGLIAQSAGIESQLQSLSMGLFNTRPWTIKLLFYFGN
jgi:hypothetical protein